MKDEDFLRCMNELDNDLIQEAAEDPYFAESGTILLEHMNDLDEDLIAEASGFEMTEEEKRPGTGRARVVSISSRFMKAAAVALLIGTASMTAVSYNGGDGTQQSAARVTETENSETEKKNSQKSRGDSGKHSDTDKADSVSGTETPADSSTRNDPVTDSQKEDVTEKNDGSGNVSQNTGKNTENTRSSDGAGNAGKSAGSGQTNAAGSGRTGKNGASGGKSSGSRGSSQNSAENNSENHSDHDTTQRSGNAYGRASFNGNTYYADHTETPNWEVSNYLGTVELSSRDREDSMTAEAYSIAGSDDDEAIGVRIGNSDKIYTYISADAGKKKDNTQSGAESGASSDAGSSAESNVSENTAGTKKSNDSETDSTSAETVKSSGDEESVKDSESAENTEAESEAVSAAE